MDYIALILVIIVFFRHRRKISDLRDHIADLYELLAKLDTENRPISSEAPSDSSDNPHSIASSRHDPLKSSARITNQGDQHQQQGAGENEGALAADPQPSQQQPGEHIEEAIAAFDPTDNVQPEPVEIAAPADQPEPAKATYHKDTAETPEDTIDHPQNQFSFEEIFGRRLSIWAVWATLIVAGALLVKYSIDQGLLLPMVQVILGLMFGAMLTGSAFIARKFADKIGDPRIAQALAGAGIAVFYICILLAHQLYGLITPSNAFAGFVITAIGAALLARLFGPPAAILALIGGLAAPMIADSNAPNVALLSGYLMLIVGGLCALGKSQKWLWLGALALTGGMGWGVTMLAIGTYNALDFNALDSIGFAALMLAIGFALPLYLIKGNDRAEPQDQRAITANMLQILASLAAMGQIAFLVAKGGYDPLNWGLFALLAAIASWLSLREQNLQILPLCGMAIALGLCWFWPEPNNWTLLSVLVGMILIAYAPIRWGFTKAQLEDRLLSLSATLLAVGGTIIWEVQTYLLLETGFARLGSAMVILALAALLVEAMLAAERRAFEENRWRFTIMATIGALIAFVAWLSLPIAPFENWSGLMLAVLSLPLLWLAHRHRASRMQWPALIYSSHTDSAEHLARAMDDGDIGWIARHRNIAQATCGRLAGATPQHLGAGRAAIAVGYGSIHLSNLPMDDRSRAVIGRASNARSRSWLATDYLTAANPLGTCNWLAACPRSAAKPASPSRSWLCCDCRIGRGVVVDRVAQPL